MSTSDEDRARVKRDELMAALAASDFPRIYQILAGGQRVPVTQVSAITGERTGVRACDVLVRVAEGLGIPPALVELPVCCCQVRRQEVEATQREVMAAYERLRADPEAWQDYLADPAPDWPELAAPPPGVVDGSVES